MSKSAEVKRELRFNMWISQVQEYNSRPEGMSMTAWCRQNNIAPSTFSTRLRKVQDRFLDEKDSKLPLSSINMEMIPSRPAFVEIPSNLVTANSHMVSIGCGGIKLEISDNTSEDFLIKLIGALNHAK